MSDLRSPTVPAKSRNSQRLAILMAILLLILVMGIAGVKTAVATLRIRKISGVMPPGVEAIMPSTGFPGQFVYDG